MSISNPILNEFRSPFVARGEIANKLWATSTGASFHYPNMGNISIAMRTHSDQFAMTV
jgi:hypothetical protein